MAFLQRAMANCLKSKRSQPGLVKYLSKETETPRQQVRKLIAEKDTEKIQAFVEPVLARISTALKTRTVELQPIRRQVVTDRMSGKERNVGVQCIESCLYDHIAVLALQDLFKTIGQFQMASIPGRGQLCGALKISEWLKDKRQRYFVKLDVKKCYESIPLPKLLQFIKKKVANPTLVYLVEKLLSKHENGLSIGSYLSQWSCNFYISYLYHHIEENLYHERHSKRTNTTTRSKLADHAMIYMDDILLLGRNKRHVRKAAAKVQAFLKEELGLETKPNWQVCDIEEVRNGKKGFIDMMGYRCHRGYLTIRRRIWKKVRRTIIRASRQLHENGKVTLSTSKSFGSYYGYIKGSESSVLRITYGVDRIKLEIGQTMSSYSKRANTLQYAKAS